MKSKTTPPDDAETVGLDPAEICTLPSEALDDRLAWIRREILPHATRTASLPGGVSVDLLDTPGLAEKIDRLIALESKCCSEITFERHAGEKAGQLRLVIRGIDPDSSIFQSLGAAASYPPTGRAAATSCGKSC